MPIDPDELPGSRTCVGCNGLTFRNREDGLCPRCAFQAESLIEQIELEGLEHDLALMTRFEAYCTQRDRATAEREARALVFAGTGARVDAPAREHPFGAARTPDFPAAWRRLG
jgi:hypothetical protein